MEHSDIVIVGAGPAGCIFALTIKNDVSVTILEKESIEALGHDWIDGFDLGIVKDYPFIQHVEKVADSAPTIFYSPDGTTSLIAPFQDRIDIDRKILAKNLITALEKKPNIKILDQVLVKAPLIEEDYVIGVKFSQNNVEHSIKARLVVDATGYPAVVRKMLPEKFNFIKELAKGDTIIAFRKYIRQPQFLTSKEFKVFFGKYRGISWINTDLADLIDLFAGVPNFNDHKKPQEIILELEQLLISKYGDQLDLNPVRANHGGVIPTRRCLDSFCENGILLIGDAACQAEPISGSGIASGMLAGYLAAQLVNELLTLNKLLTRENLWPYNYTWIATVGARYASIDVIRLFLLSRTENELNFLLKKKIISEKDLKGSLTGEKMRTSLTDLLQKLWRGMSRLGLLLELYGAIKDSNKIKELYLSYPPRFDEQEFQAWQQKKDKIFKKYYKKLRKLVI